MATYKKRGYKPKAKKESDAVEENFNEEESTTAEVFNNLDEGANKTEEWVSENQKPILIGIGVVVVAVLGYLAFTKFVQEPKELDAANDIAQAQIYFEDALDASGKAQDSLYNLALQGGNGKFGLLDVIDSYGSTATGNLAHYYAGIAYLNTGEYKEAINHLEQFSSDDEIIAPLAKGAIGDAFMQLNQPEEALDYYEKAAKLRKNEFTTPKFLLKAAITALELKDGEKAEKYLNQIDAEYQDSAEASEVAIYLGQAKAMQ
ncbi:tol-pal system YbgF family protein [Mesonia sp. HuA40]|uniref:tetratricopeptide repeat protein n=1 Tax=Mesonia sp. HuA40 TaxID=2602761 RepID=UPI0011CB2754|nr:tetratricopeptide repeat protein [Mesonia sp. HuA40]TXK74344.1 tetratricopeptide repeat protein [Mesonia sp. HuA40]